MSGVQTPARADIWFDISNSPAPVANSAMMSTLTAHCQWVDNTLRERIGHPPSYAEAKKMKSLTLHTHSCPWASLRDYSSYFQCAISGFTSKDKNFRDHAACHQTNNDVGVFHV